MRDRFQALRLNLNSPDLNQSDFFHLTLTRQIQQVQTECLATQAPVTVIGSSFGGLTAAWLGEKQDHVHRLVLLAPAFQFLAHWLPKLGAEQLQQWQDQQHLSVYHYSSQQMQPLSYRFVTDAEQYSENQLQRPVPTLILHGVHDDVIPIQASRDYAVQRPWVQLVELDSDHALDTAKDEIWQAIKQFCRLKER